MATALILKCLPDNDLYRVLVASGYTCSRYEDTEQALRDAPPGTAVLLLADEYPCGTSWLSQPFWDLIAGKQLRLYVEYPTSLPGWEVGEPCRTSWERLVVSSPFFTPDLPQHTILTAHACWFLPMRPTPADSHQGSLLGNVPLALARVAGYDRAILGLPEEVYPFLLQLDRPSVLVAASKLSQFVTGRYAPRMAWTAVWRSVLRWLASSDTVPELAWEPTVQVQAAASQPLGDHAERDALKRSTLWFRNHVVYSIDRKKGAIEGFESAIDHAGRQMQRTWARGDCTSETGMVFACDWALAGDPDSRLLATQILDYVWSSDFFQDDPGSPAYGLSNWYERGPVFYGDDNARVVLSTLFAAHLMQQDRWDERVLRCVLANLRTTGVLGFRKNRIDLAQLVEHPDGWWRFYCQDTVSLAPHYQAYLWAAYLLTYAITGADALLDKTRLAIRLTMDAYPRWKWTNGLTQEMARMLLPLAFLVRIEDTVEHRRWLERIAGDLLQHMQPCGAIQEQLGPLESGQYAPPQSNASYGTSEASLIQENGDPACDLLYTANYAFLGLHEAAAAAYSAPLIEAENRLAGFLCRIQARSTDHPYLDGAWMRGFDYVKWEPWGSSADAGWGAWCVESGWTNSWIAAVLAMRAGGWCLFDVAYMDRPRDPFLLLLEEMFQGHASP